MYLRDLQLLINGLCHTEPVNAEQKEWNKDCSSALLTQMLYQMALS